MSTAKVLWFTGLSGSGKSTITCEAQAILKKENRRVKILDGDAIRTKRRTPLHFTREDILANNAEIATFCKQKLCDYDYIFVSVISPFKESRARSRQLLGKTYHEVYVKASLDKVIDRDTKGLYRKALKGEIKNFIGIDRNIAYEPPEQCELVLSTENEQIVVTVQRLIDYIKSIEEKK